MVRPNLEEMVVEKVEIALMESLQFLKYFLYSSNR